MDSSKQFVKITGGVNLDEGLDIKKAQTYLNQLETIFKNLSENGNALAGALRKTTDKISRDFYVDASQAQNAIKAMDAVRRANVHTGDGDSIVNPIFFDKETKSVEMVTFQRKLLETNKRKIQELKAFVARTGGNMSDTTNAGFYSFTMPNASYMSDTGQVTSLPNYVRAKITRQNKYVKERANVASAFDDRAAYAAEYEKTQARINEMHMKQNVKSSAVSETKPSDDKDSESGGSKSLKSMKTLAGFAIAIKFLSMIYDVLKDIYERVMATAGKNYDAIKTGAAVGLSGVDVINYQYGAAARGMQPGVFTEGMQSVVNKFGNITSLDNDALKKLAIVLGSQVQDLVQSGIGGKDPEKLYNMILKSFVDRAVQGKNSVGMDVGTNRAIIELTEYLRKIDPNWAEVFSRMMVDYTSTTVDKKVKDAVREGPTAWVNAINVNRSGRDGLDATNSANLKKDSLEVKAIWTSALDGSFARLAQAIDDLLNGLRPFLRTFMNPEEKANDEEATRVHNTQQSTVFRGVATTANAAYSDTENTFLASVNETRARAGLLPIKKGVMADYLDLKKTPKELKTLFGGTALTESQYALFMQMYEARKLAASASTKADEADRESRKEHPKYVDGGPASAAAEAREQTYNMFAPQLKDAGSAPAAAWFGAVVTNAQKVLGTGDEAKAELHKALRSYATQAAQSAALYNTIPQSYIDNGNIKEIKVHVDGNYARLEIIPTKGEATLTQPIQIYSVINQDGTAAQVRSTYAQQLVNNYAKSKGK